MLVSIGAYQICNGTLVGGVAVSELRLNVDRTFDIVIPIPLTLTLAAAIPIALDRLTSKVDMTFTVKRSHGSLAASEQFILLLEETLPRSGNITLIATGGVTRYIKNGAIVSHNLTQYIGSTTFHQYHMIGGPTSATP